MSAGTVYVIQSGEYYKIGRTRNLTERLDALRIGSPAPLTVIYHVETLESAGLERELHRRFVGARVRGEWYQLTAEQLAAIMAIRVWPLPRSLTEAEQLSLELRGTNALRDLLKAHGIPTIAEFRRRAGLSKQHAWNLWHGEANIGVRLARRLEARLGIPYTVFLELERERPPAVRPPGRPRKRPASLQPRSKGRAS